NAGRSGGARKGMWFFFRSRPRGRGDSPPRSRSAKSGEYPAKPGKGAEGGGNSPPRSRGSTRRSRGRGPREEGTLPREVGGEPGEAGGGGRGRGCGLLPGRPLMTVDRMTASGGSLVSLRNS